MDVLIDDLVFGEGPRWHDGRLWLSDMHDGKVLTVDADGSRQTVCEVAGKPSGLGWLPDGRLLVVSMTDRRIVVLDGDGTLGLHADLSALVPYDVNDMVVDGRGNAYAGHFGFSFHDGMAPGPAEVVLIRADGGAEVAATDLLFPNGSVVTPDGSTLIVAESLGSRLTAFTIRDDGTLADRRVWAALDSMPDGICLDAEGAVWYADPGRSRCVRVAEGGEVLATLETPQSCYACMLGGADGRTLFLVTATFESIEQVVRERNGRVLVAGVDTPGAGWP
ncbi:MAG: SMP-30/gluconolactonase/LRE family protein [Acidimicrobiia bacterium]